MKIDATKLLSNQIVLYCHCVQCARSKPMTVSMKDWAMLSIGKTANNNIQVWCDRHSCNVMIVETTKEYNNE
jgi:hypothetical protein